MKTYCLNGRLAETILGQFEGIIACLVEVRQGVGLAEICGSATLALQCFHSLLDVDG